MNTVTSSPGTDPSYQSQHTESASSLPELADRTPRTSLVDRIALRIGLRLLLWSTHPPASRPVPAAEAERRAAELRATAERARSDYTARMFTFSR